MSPDHQALAVLGEPFRGNVLRFLISLEKAQTDTVDDVGNVTVVPAENSWRVVAHGEPRTDGLGIDLSLTLTLPIFATDGAGQAVTLPDSDASLARLGASFGVLRVAGTPARWSVDGLAQPAEKG